MGHKRNLEKISRKTKWRSRSPDQRHVAGKIRRSVWPVATLDAQWEACEAYIIKSQMHEAWRLALSGRTVAVKG
jgi:hypothetical protein